MNEILILHKLLHFSNNYNSYNNKVLEKAQNAQSLFIARILAEKLFEGWRLLQTNYFGNQVSMEYNDLLTEQGRDCLNQFKSYFSRDNSIEKVRNRFATHYFTSSEGIAQQFEKIPENQAFELYFGPEEGNCLYHVSHIFMTLAVLEAVGASDIQNAMMSLFSDLFKTAEWFIDFSQDFIEQFVIKYFGETHDKVEIPDVHLPSFVDIKLPYFFKRT